MPARSDPALRAAARSSRRAPARRSTAKRTAATRAATRTRTSARPASTRRSAPLPGWGDLGAGQAGLAREPRTPVRLLDRVPPVRLVALIVVGCLIVTLYVGHVYATRATAADLQAATRENLHLHLKRERLRGMLDRLTGPAVILNRAAALGLEEGISYGPVIRLDD